MSRWENAPTTRELASMMAAMIDIYCASYPAPPTAVTLDIDDTCDVVHGYQQLSFWNGHHGERCFLPIHIYDTATGRRSEEHTAELKSLMRISYAVFCLKT